MVTHWTNYIFYNYIFLISKETLTVRKWKYFVGDPLMQSSEHSSLSTALVVYVYYIIIAHIQLYSHYIAHIQLTFLLDGWPPASVQIPFMHVFLLNKPSSSSSWRPASDAASAEYVNDKTRGGVHRPLPLYLSFADATLFRPFPEKSDRFYVFSSDICRYTRWWIPFSQFRFR